MPLSEDEQRILSEIEDHLYESDPSLAREVAQTTIYTHAFRNLKRVAKELGENMTDEELQEMIDEADRDGDGEINEDEFLRIMKKTSLY